MDVVPSSVPLTSKSEPHNKSPVVLYLPCQGRMRRESKEREKLDSFTRESFFPFVYPSQYQNDAIIHAEWKGRKFAASFFFLVFLKRGREGKKCHWRASPVIAITAVSSCYNFSQQNKRQ